MAPTEPHPMTWTLRFKRARKTVLLHVDPLAYMCDIKAELLRALRITHPDGRLGPNLPIPEAPEDVLLARAVDGGDYSRGWVRLQTDEADFDEADAAVAEIKADETGRRPSAAAASKGKAKKKTFPDKAMDSTPRGLGLKDGCELAFRFRQEGDGVDLKWAVVQLTYDDVVGPASLAGDEDVDEGIVPDLMV